MKITILGAGGVRTPLIVQSMIKRQESIGLRELALMDIDGERLDLIGALTSPLENSGQAKFTITRTTDASQALNGADFVITTFRVGGIESRVVDERVPLNLGVLGQETTGPGGFAMGMRSIPVLLDYARQMKTLCPDAWLINFANPAGMMAEALVRTGVWPKSVGICDAPSGMQRLAAVLIGKQPETVFLDYFGLNHLGWVRSVIHEGRDYLPDLLAMLVEAGSFPGLPFDPALVRSLGMYPNEYLYYYYYARQSVENILRSEETRGEEITLLNQELFADLQRMQSQGRFDNMLPRYEAYLDSRHGTYMSRETGLDHIIDPEMFKAMEGEGYAGVALDLIEGLVGVKPQRMILNIANHGSVHGMQEDDVVEIPAYVGPGMIRPMAVGKIPDHQLGLMLQVKAYERLTIEAAVEGSYAKALQALTIHPLVRDYSLAKQILDGFIEGHAATFPKLR